MDILQILTSFFPSGSSEQAAVKDDKKVQAICDILRSYPVTARSENMKSGIDQVYKGVPEEGMSTEEVVAHIINSISPGLAAGQSGPRYFGFVTGGALPAAQCGDILATIYDQNVQVHLPNESISTAVEWRTLEMVLDLLDLPRDLFGGRSLTGGATASNILGIACGRDYAVQRALNDATYSVADNGMPSGVRIRVLTDRHHASIEKATAIVGIGRKNVVDLSATSKGLSTPFVNRLESALQVYHGQAIESGEKVGFIVVVSFAEVNTGDFTDMEGVKRLCDKYSAWLHIDAAFGALACLLPEYSNVSGYLKDADSITADGHKTFNTPYASGIFFTRSASALTAIMAGSTIPAYLAAPPSTSQDALDPTASWLSSIPSPLHTNLDNSRRFIALPLYSSILHMGRKGYHDLMERNVLFAREIAEWMSNGDGSQWYECLNLRDMDPRGERITPISARGIQDFRTVPLNVVLFRARNVDNVPVSYRRSTSDEQAKQDVLATIMLIKDINATKRMFVSPGAYPGGAIRIAVSNWMTGLNDSGTDLECVKEVLQEVMTGATEP
ncbi:hypothetical protein M408DRAFT_329689 [Serendipita vermifera MAFF 305830]|uniref:Uncharacterized protein n=1 Tax=Serendipita vermifera MAFF 305830 TaxID=933852 RepID=A0A0C2WP71_SERVB|nr:hypothetical protein M408DRAFT_329689 [Serendipita vermifera MAFF 305830]